jgi:hypothetical protein
MNGVQRWNMLRHHSPKGRSRSDEGCSQTSESCTARRSQTRRRRAQRGRRREGSNHEVHRMPHIGVASAENIGVSKQRD